MGSCVTSLKVTTDRLKRRTLVDRAAQAGEQQSMEDDKKPEPKKADPKDSRIVRPLPNVDEDLQSLTGGGAQQDGPGGRRE